MTIGPRRFRNSVAAAPLVAMVFCGIALAQGAGTAGQSPALEGVTLGESMQQVRDTIGDPVQLRGEGDQQIWRYLERGGAVYLDVIPRNNIVSSVTVLRRFDNSPYTDQRGVSFGMSAADVRAKLGSPSKESTNADDGSLDLWYVSGDDAWIYELLRDKLGFVQIVARPDSQSTAVAGDRPIVPANGSSIADAIRIRPPNVLGSTTWIDAYLTMNECGDSGHWKEASSTFQRDAADLMAYTIVHATCTSGGAEKTFYFDTRGMLTKNGASSGSDTLYIDVNQIRSTHPSPSPSPTP